MIEVQHLTKRFGDKLAVDDLSFRVRPGIVTGFLGPNGAGKSTTMRMMLGLDRPTSGAARINGRSFVDSSAPL
jgi:ABC-2 type transport system ATP-binding protein